MTGAQPRFAALTYTADLNGFGVKDTRGGLTDPEAGLLAERLEVSPDFGITIPDVHSARDAPLPRRCVWTTIPEGGVFWHLAPAGRDSTGRPGNFFVHGILDRTPELPDHRGQALPRPSDWIGSPDILQPFGGAASDAARLPDKELPDAGEEVTADTVVAHLLEEGAGDRSQLLGSLLDGISARREGGPPVVLATRTVEDAAQWIGLVNHLVAPATARTLSWSLLESPGSSVTARAEHLSLDVACIRHEAIPEVDPEAYLVVDGGDGSERVDGTSDWALLATAVLDWAEDGDDLRRADEIAGVVGCPAGTHLAWPLAMLAALEPDRFPAVQEVARRVLLHTPSGIAQAPASYQATVTEAVSAEVGGDIDAIYDHLLGQTTRTGVTDLLWRAYLSQLTTRPERLLGLRPLPIPPVRLDAVTSQDVDAVATWLDSRAQDEEADLPFVALRVVDHLVGLGLASTDEGVDEGVSEQLRLIVEKHVEPRLGDLLGLVRRCGPLREDTASLIVRPALGWAEVVQRTPVGEALDAETAMWLAPSGLQPIIATPPREVTPLELAMVLSQTRESRTVSDWLLEILADGLSGTETGPLSGTSTPRADLCSVLLERAHSASPLTPARLQRLLPHLPADLRERWTAIVLLQTPGLDQAAVDILRPSAPTGPGVPSPDLQASRALVDAAVAGPHSIPQGRLLSALAGLVPMAHEATSVTKLRTWSDEVRALVAASLLAAASLEQCGQRPAVDALQVEELRLGPADLRRGAAFLATALSRPAREGAQAWAEQRATVAVAAVIERGGSEVPTQPILRALLRQFSPRRTREAPLRPLGELIASCDRSSWGKAEVSAVSAVVDRVFGLVGRQYDDAAADEICDKIAHEARDLVQPRTSIVGRISRLGTSRRQDQE